MVNVRNGSVDLETQNDSVCQWSCEIPSCKGTMPAFLLPYVPMVSDVSTGLALRHLNVKAPVS